MHINDVEVVLNESVRLYGNLFLRGWIRSESPLRHLRLEGVSRRKQVERLRLPNPAPPAPHNRNIEFFELQVWLPDAAAGLTVEFQLSNRRKFSIPLQELEQDRLRKDRAPHMGNEFRSRIRKHAGARVLDVGGRDRSGYDLGSGFEGVDFTTFDILPSENVDVVGDAHELSKHFPPGHFDFILCVSVFEHLLMPWKAALEFNKVLKVGGEALITTHQSVGMHDTPFDYWRYSDTAWDGLFNAETGFRIVDRQLDRPNLIVRTLESDTNPHERALGFEISIVQVQKVAETALEWPVTLESVERDGYAH